MIKLYLDTTTAKKAKVTLYQNEKILAQTENEGPLVSIKEAIDKANLSLEDVNIFEANPGPGSYTGIRVGLAIVNALNFAFDKKAQVTEPIYD